MNTALGLALSVGFVALGILLVRVRQELRECTQLLAHTLESVSLAQATDEHQGERWLEGSFIRPGLEVPPELLEVTSDWLLVLVSRSADLLGALLDGEGLRHLQSRYIVAACTPEGARWSGAHSLDHVIDLPHERFEGLPPMPVVAMVDPDGVVQGVGTATDSSAIFAFVGEGEAHGFGHRPADAVHAHEPHA